MQKQQQVISNLNKSQFSSNQQNFKQKIQNPNHKINENKKNHKTQPQPNSFSYMIIQMMKKIRKNSPLFKPIKKLKTSIQVIGGQDQVSFYHPTSTLIVFHFGLGNQLDKEIIINSTNLSTQYGANKLLKEFVILPGKPFTFIEFCSVSQAEEFVVSNEIKNIFVQLGQSSASNLEKKGEAKDLLLEKQQYTKEQQTINKPQINSQKHPLVYFSLLKYKNLQRMTIFFYLNKPQSPQANQQHQLITIPNCPSNYTQQNQLPGLHLIQQIITKQQQLQLLQWLDQQPWQKLSNRRVQHYGYEFKYGKNAVDKDELYRNLMPQRFHFLLERLKGVVKELSGEEIDYDQLTINDYFAGHGIPAHFDTHSPFQQYFVAVSMLSGIVMDWKRYDDIQKSTYLKERSVVVFSGQARYAWQHSIACRKLDNIDNQLKHRSRRISLTFRKIKRTPCFCKYYFYCDSQGYQQNTMKKMNPLLNKYLCEENKTKLKNMSKQHVYKQYVTKAYNSFGYDFHNKVIPQIKQYLTQQSCEVEQSKQCKLVLDIGCGNGEYKQHLKSDKLYYVGVERCEVMLAVEDEVHMDGLRLGFRDGAFDVVLLIAVLHHFVEESDRVRCLRQARRMMAQNGVMYLTVFNYQGKKQQYPEQDILLDYCLPVHKVITNKEVIKQNNESIHSQQCQQQQLNSLIKQDILKQQGKKTQKGQIFSRYYHLFMRQQLQELIQKAGLRVQQLKLTKENIVVKLRNV